MKSANFAATLKLAFQRFLDKDPFQMGAALAYYTVFSLAPLVLIAVAVAAMFFDEKAAEGKIGREIENAVGSTVAAAITETLQNARKSASGTTASIVGLVILIFGASGVFVQLQSSLNTIWEAPNKKPGGVWGFIRTRLLSFAMVLGIGFLLLVSLIVSAALSAINGYLAPGQTALYQIVNQIVSFGFITALFALIFRYLPDCRVDWADVWLGSALTALLFVLGKYLIGLYLAKGGPASAYGAAGSLVVILLWVYYASQILLFGAAFTRVMAMQRQSSASLVQCSD